MATNTPNLNLLKKDPVTDGNETFNIQTMLNDNWDKIDAAVGEIDIPDASLTVKGKVQLSNETDSDAEDRAATSRAVKAVSDNFAAQLADVAQEAQAAKTLGDERKQQVVDALIAWGVSASMADSWDTLFLKMTTVIKATGNATAADVLAGKTFSNANGNGLLGAMPHLTGTRNAAGVAQWPDGALAVYPEKGYQKGGVGDGEIKVSVAQLQQAELDLVAGNILNGKVIFGITGTLKDASNIVVVEHAPSVTQSDAEYNRVIDFPAGYTPIAWSGAAV
ncbi:MAG: phage tail protein, partial [Paenibacillus sp.]|uniref:phage tail protein n=1 Tax=Paenibacillus sp. TaxID=58172 RepID=UPI002901B2E0